MKMTSAGSEDPVLQWVTFRLDETYGINVMRSGGVALYRDRAGAGCPSYVLGIIAWRQCGDGDRHARISA